MADEGFEFPVDRTQVMLFARSLLDIRPEFSDPNDPATKAVGGIVTPPTFVQCSAHWQPNYPLDITRPRQGPPPAFTQNNTTSTTTRSTWATRSP